MADHSLGIVGCIVMVAALLSGYHSAAAPAPDDVLTNDGDDDTNPINRFDVRSQATWLPDEVTSEGTFDGLYREAERLRTDLVLFSAPNQVKLRVDLPLAWSNAPTSQNPSGATQFGLGDVLLQGLYAHPLDSRWAVAAGARMILPTATNMAVGGGKWQVGPTVEVRASLPEVSAGSFVSVTVRQFFSAAGDLSGRDSRYARDYTSIQPSLKIELPNQWYINSQPNIQYNLNSGKWFVPVDAIVGKKFGKKWTLSLEYAHGIILDNPKYTDFVDFQVGYFY